MQSLGKLYIVYGPPLSGKTTYVKEHMKASDIVIDLDYIKHALTFVEYKDEVNDNRFRYIWSIRNYLLENRIEEGDTWLITTRHEDINLECDKLIELVPNKNELIDRLYRDETRQDKDKWIKIINRWFNDSRETGVSSDYNKGVMKFYNSKAWRTKRLEILERDNYECQECKANGKLTIANDKSAKLNVHHIKELTDYPELALEDDNLITVCVSCHNRIHGRYKHLNMFESENKIAEDIPERW